MSSTFQILNNRPIDKWKVVELREELKKRRLTTRGLKKDLVKRLDAAIRAEREKAAEEADNGSNDDNSEPVVDKGTEKTTPTIAEKVKEVAGRGGLKRKDDTADCVAASGRKLDEKDEKNGFVYRNSVSITEKAGLKGSIIDDNVKISLDVVKPVMVEPYSSNGSGQGVAEEKDILVEDEPVIQTTVVKTVLPEVSLIGQHLESSKLEENVNSDMKMECQDPMPQVENEGPKALLENEDGMHGSSALNNQVSEISPISGFQVKPDSVSTDPMSITEKIELKDSIVDDNVMSKMMEPYSSSGSGEGVLEQMDMLVEDEPVIQATEVKTMILEEPFIEHHLQSSKQEENVNSNMQMESQDRKLEAESDDPMAQLENEDHMDDVHERFKDVVDHGSSELEFKDALSDFEASSDHGVVEETDMLVDDKPVLTKVTLVGEHLQSSETKENENINTQMECQDGKLQVVTKAPLVEEYLESLKQEEIVNSNKQMECQDAKSKVENEGDSIAQLEEEDDKDDIHETAVVDHGGSELEFKDAISDFEASSDHGVVEETDMLVDDKPVLTKVTLVGEHLQSSETKENENINTQMECQDGKLQVVTKAPLVEEYLESLKQEEIVNSNKQMECQDAKSKVENEGDSIAQLEEEDDKDDIHETAVVDHGGSELEFKDAISDFETSSVHGVVEETDMLVDDKPVVIEVPLVGEHLQSSELEENVNSNTQMECQDGNPQVVTEAPLIEEHLKSSKREEIVNSNKQMECQDAKSKVENEDDSIAQLENEDDKDDMHETAVVDHGGSELEFKDAISDCEAASGHGVVEETEMLGEDKPVVIEVPLVGEHLQSSKLEENVNSNTQIERQDGNPQVVIQVPLIEEHLESSKREEIVNSNKQMECQDAKSKVENEDDSIAQLENEDDKDDMHETAVVDHGGSELEFKDAISDCEAASGHGVVEETEMLGEDKPVVIEVPLVGEHLQSSKLEENVNSNTQIERQDGNPQVVMQVPLIEEHLESSKLEEIVNSNKQMESQYAKSKVDNEDDSIAHPENEDNKDDMHETVKDIVDHGGSEIEKGNELKFKDAIRDCEAASGHGVVEETDIMKDKPVLTDVPLVREHLQSSEPEENVNSNTQMECQDGNPQVVTEVSLVEKHLQSSKREENVNSDKQMKYQDAMSQMENEDDLMDQLVNEDYKNDMHEKAKDVVDHGGSEIEKVSELKSKDVIGDCEAASDHGAVKETDMVKDKLVLTEVPLAGEHLQSSKPENNISYTQMECRDRNPQVMTEVPLIEEHLERSQQEENVNSNNQTECQDAMSLVKNEGLKVEVETEDPKAHLESGDGMHDSSSLNNQVQEINPVSGFQVKPDSIVNDSMPINEKTDLKDNINDENVKLSQYVFKLEMVKPCSSTNVVPNNGESHPMEDDEQPLMNKASFDEIDENSDTTADMSNKDKSEEMGYSEKLNLDRSSNDDSIEEDLPETKQIDSNCTTDDSMEEDLPETKQIDSNCTTDEIEEDSMENKALIIEELESTVVGAGDGSSTEQKDIIVENKSHSSGKRKLQDVEAIEDNRPPKRQKCNSDNLQVPEQQATYLTPINTPNDTMQFGASQSNFSSSDSTDSEDTPKERDVFICGRSNRDT